MSRTLPDVDRDFDSRFISTIGVDFKIKTFDRSGKTVKLQLWDTAGQERFRAITTSYYRGADGIMLVYDVTNAESLAALSRTWACEIENYAGKRPRIILVGNKVDLRKDVSEAERAAVASQLEELKARLNYDGELVVIEASAKGGGGVDAAFERLVDDMCAETLVRQRRAAETQARARAADGGWVGGWASARGINLLSPSPPQGLSGRPAQSGGLCCNLL